MKRGFKMKILAYRFLNCRFLHEGFYCNNNSNNNNNNNNNNCDATLL